MKKRFFTALLAFTMLLPSCRSSFDNTPASDKSDTAASVELRPVETITLNLAWPGANYRFGSEFLPFNYAHTMVNGNFYLEGRLYNLKKIDLKTDFAYAVVSPAGELTGYRGIPVYAKVEKDDERRFHAGQAIYENGIAVWDGVSRYDLATNQTIAYKNHYLSAYDAENNLLYRINPEPLIENRTNPLTGSDADFSPNPSRMLYGANGTLYLVMEYSVVAIGPGGEKLYETGTEYYINDAARHPDGRILVNYTKFPEITHHWAYMDDERKGFSDPITVPDPGLEEYTLVWGSGHDFYFNARDGLYCMDAGDDAPILLCSWEESGVKYDSIKCLLIADENTVLVYTTVAKGMDTTREYTVLNRPAADESATRQIITLGDDNNQIDFSEYVSRFNRTNSKYYIVIRDYAKLAAENGNSLTEDILAGTAPDLVCAKDFSSMEHLAEKGTFADLNVFLSADKELSGELVNYVLDLCEPDGTRFYLPGGVRIQGTAGKAKNLPSPADWTPDTFFSLMQSAEQSGRRLIVNVTQDTMTDILIRSNLGAYTDMETAVCSFDSEEFVEMLRYLQSLPTVSDVHPNAIDLRKSYREDQILATTGVQIGQFLDLLELRVQFGGEDLTFPGTPTDAGGVLPLSTVHSFSITADSPVKEGAWEFIRYILMQEKPGHTSGLFSLPVTRSMIREQAKAEGQMFYIIGLDERSMRGYAWDGVTPKEYDPQRQMGIYVTEQDTELILDLLDNRKVHNASTAAREKILELINEELSAFFAGNVTAEEAAKRIQSRVSIYLAEQS